MASRPKGSRTVDPLIGSRLVNACWLAASLGGATLQFRLLAQALSTVLAEGAGQYQGTLIACLGLAWLVGKLVGQALSKQAGRGTWGIWLLGTVLAWLVTSLPGFALRLPLESVVSHLMALASIAFLLALFSSAWMIQERPWPALHEGTTQVASLTAVLAGLCTAWLLPGWSGAIGVLLLLPLLSLDLWPEARCPLPEPRRARAAATGWLAHLRPGNIAQLGQVTAPTKQTGWWWSWLASRRKLSLTLLQSGVTIILTSVWIVVPTLYASSLARAQRLEILLWLLGGQLCALLLFGGALHTRAGRRLLGTSTIIPAFHHLTLLSAWGMPLLAAICLATLGNPWLQAPWLLGLAIAGYTLAVAAWQRLLPRLLRGTATGAGMADPSAPWNLPEAGGAQDLTKIRLARDNLARRSISRWEQALLGGMTLLTGTLCDQWGVDPILVLAGCALVGVAGLTMLNARYTDRPIDAQDQPPPGTSAQEGKEFAATDALHPVPSSSAAPVPMFRGDGASSGAEHFTTAQYPVHIPGPLSERRPHRIAAQYSPLPVDGEGEGGLAHDDNNRTIH